MDRVIDIMTEEPSCCTPEMRLQDAARLMVERDCGEIPVINNWKERIPVGVITDRDICCRAFGRGKNPLALSVKDCMSAPVITVLKETSIEDCCALMEEKQIRRLPVVNERNECCGMISQADIARHESRILSGNLLQNISRPIIRLSAH